MNASANVGIDKCLSTCLQSSRLVPVLDVVAGPIEMCACFRDVLAESASLTSEVTPFTKYPVHARSP